RLADAASVPLLAPMLVWLPVAIGLVATSWLVGPLGSAGADLASERMLVALVGLGTMTLAALAALAQDDLGHATAYLAIADAGLILVACGVDGPVVVPPLRTALLALLASKTGLVAWLVATESAYGTRRLPDLGGWARRSPLLGLAFSVVAIATVGWPGSPMLDARLDVVRFATGSAAPIAAIALFAALPAYARTLWIGLGRPFGAVAAAETSRLRRPAAWAVGDGGRARERLGALARDLTAVWALDRRPGAAAAVLLLALLGVAITAGAWPTPA
ncbi:MAG TPA: proton-conducting transporter membrane subunit, partial [Candidatus Dormibacteraeota bacterium]|nr:proton-conducting transporter membrane subunit [Candidatus Dormibacteraeota bacterium]